MPNAPVPASATGLPSITRRRLLAASAHGAAVAGGLTVMAAPVAAAYMNDTYASTDAQLVALGRDFEAAVWAGQDRALSDEAADISVALAEDIALRTIDFAPASLAGLRTKVEALLYFTMDCWSPNDWRVEGGGEPEGAADRILLSLAADVVRLREARA